MVKTLQKATVVAALLMGSASHAEEPTRTRLFEKVDLKGGRELQISIQLPDDFRSDRAYPFLVGPGEPKNNAERGRFWQDVPAQHGWVVVESLAALERDPVDVSRRLFAWLLQHFQVEGQRFHLIGWSANSSGTFKVAVEMPHLLASVTGMPGFPRERDPEKLKALSATQVQLIVGERDKYWLERSRGVVEQLQELGVKATLEVIPDGSHILDELSGKPLIERLDKLRPEQP